MPTNKKALPINEAGQKKNSLSIIASQPKKIKNELAHEYLDMGLKITPIWGAYGGLCNCPNESECISPGRHSVSRFMDPIIDHEEVDHYWPDHDGLVWYGDYCFPWNDEWRIRPENYIGFLTGKRGGIVVMVIKTKHGGISSLKKLLTEFGSFPKTVRARAGKEEFYFYFTCPPGGLKTHRNFLPGIDILADGSYTLAPGSKYSNDCFYQWDTQRDPESIEMAPPPAWLLTQVQEA